MGEKTEGAARIGVDEMPGLRTLRTEQSRFEEVLARLSALERFRPMGSAMRYECPRCRAVMFAAQQHGSLMCPACPGWAMVATEIGHVPEASGVQAELKARTIELESVSRDRDQLRAAYLTAVESRKGDGRDAAMLSRINDALPGMPALDLDECVRRVVAERDRFRIELDRTSTALDEAGAPPSTLEVPRHLPSRVRGLAGDLRAEIARQNVTSHAVPYETRVVPLFAWSPDAPSMEEFVGGKSPELVDALGPVLQIRRSGFYVQNARNMLAAVDSGDLPPERATEMLGHAGVTLDELRAAVDGQPQDTNQEEPVGDARAPQPQS